MIDEINAEISPYSKQLLNHPLYREITTPEDLRIFMEHHVFAVWDFMSLLKSLQETLTRTTTPWFPVGNPEVRYLINEIVLAEETDINMFGKRQSHYEMYLDAMHKAGANTQKISTFIQQLEEGAEISPLLSTSQFPESIKQFLKLTFNIIQDARPHQIAAAFTFGREGLIPEMFNSIISRVQENFPKEDLDLFKYYFDRHIELDADEHGPMAFKMVEELCGEDPVKWQEVQQTAKACLQSRIKLWDGIQHELASSKN
jgi:hypothetical protein